jgi:hypothetical protein
MRRIATLACGLACLSLPATASAAIDTSVTAGEVAASTTSNVVSSAAFAPVLPTGTVPVAVSDTPLAGFPIQGTTFAILTNGTAALAGNPQTEGASVATNAADTARGPSAFDITVLRMNVNVPAAANCLTLGFRFLSEEYPGFVGGAYNDAFIAEVDPGTQGWTANADLTITAPNNFAFDEDGAVISVNTSGATSMSAGEATGTVYGGATPRLSAAQAVSPGAHELVLSIFDQGDHSLDSAVFIDRLSFLSTEAGGCVPGAQADEVPPAVTLGVSRSSADDTTPTLGGAAGDAPGDAATLNVRVFSGGAASGTPVQTLTTTRSGTSWAVDTAPLAPGTYTAQADQADTAGNIGVSAPAIFTVEAPQQKVEAEAAQSPVPVIGKTVVAGRVGTGTVLIRLKNGKFRKLGAKEAIPLGSEIDATKGRVRLTSASGPGGATQTADFYQGAFRVTQTRGNKPITQLALSARLSCGKKGTKAQASAKKKKVRRLWGDGKGSFRTRGRNAAATVRGTKWLTEDRCDSTKITVKRGKVLVRDFLKRKNFLIKKGHSYVAQKKKKK